MWKIIKRVLIVLVVGFVALVVWRMFVLEGKEDTAVQVERIHNTKLTLSDVMGENLPPLRLRSGQADYDVTVEGIDENNNGIRDDVELAIFKEYPNSARTRAVLLQYALALQMEVTQEIVNTGTVIAVAQEKSRAAQCIGDAAPKDNLQDFIKTTEIYTDFVNKQQINNKARDDAQKKFYEYLNSYSDLESTCDIELSTLPN